MLEVEAVTAIYSHRGKLLQIVAERWQSGRMRRFAKPLYGLTPVPRVRIPPSPPDHCNPNHLACQLTVGETAIEATFTVPLVSRSPELF